MRYVYHPITGIFTGTTNDNLANSTVLVPYLSNDRNTARFVGGSWTEVTIDKATRYRYNIDKNLVTVNFPMVERQALTMTDAEANHCIGFDDDGNPLYNQEALLEEAELAKKEQIKLINYNFEKECHDVGTLYKSKYFQYDDVSRSRLQEVKDDSRVTYWRSVSNENVPLTNVEKNELYDIMKLTYYTKFAQKSEVIDQL